MKCFDETFDVWHYATHPSRMTAEPSESNPRQPNSPETKKQPSNLTDKWLLMDEKDNEIKPGLLLVKAWVVIPNIKSVTRMMYLRETSSATILS